MQNEFEKQVQKKMEELQLVPSLPVWQKVEMQIRKKKDRRRLIFWIPLLLLLTGGGLWMGIDHYSNRLAYKNENGKAQKQNSITPGKPVNKAAESGKQILTHTATQKETGVEITKTKNADFNFSNKPATQKKSSQKINSGKENSFAEKMKTSATDEETTLAEVSNEVVQLPVAQKNTTDASFKLIQNTDTANGTSVRKEKIEINISNPDSLKNDTASTKKPNVKKPAASKWKLNLVAASGLSGLNQFNLFKGDSLSTAASYSGGASAGGGQINKGPSDVKKGFSFAVGAFAKKQLSKRTFFSAGLQYNYYSNTINVRDKINQNTVIMDVAVSRYYSNTTGALQPYRNQYHFISLPVAMDWRLLKKKPLNFQAGLSLKYLIQTNGLIFDYNKQAYFNSKQAFNSTQLFSGFGFTYSVRMKQTEWAFGPQLQYGLSRMEKNNSAYHIFFYGLKAQWQLSKK